MSQAPPDPASPQTPPPPGGQTSGKAIASMVVSIVSLCTCGLIGIVGIVLGNNAKSEIQASGGRITGEGMATAGIVIGWIAIVLFVIGVIIQITVGGLFTWGAMRNSSHNTVHSAPLGNTPWTNP